MAATNSRLRPTEAAGAVLVAAFVVFALLAGVDARTDGRRVTDGPEAEQAFLEAWERQRDATYAATTVFTRDADNGASARLEGRRVQRPPDELVVGLSDSELRRDDEVFRCVGGATGDSDADAVRCTGPIPGPAHRERVADDLATLASYFAGDPPLYEVTDLDERGELGCFRLDQRRPFPLAPYGRQAEFCFDGPTGALVETTLRFDNGVRERTLLTDLVTTVTDDDLRLAPPG